MRKDLFEYLYDTHWIIRAVLKIMLKIKDMVSGKVREKIRDKVEIKPEAKLKIYDAGAQPYAGFVIEIDNRNFSPLAIEAFDIQLSFGRNHSVFKTFYWSKNDISEPPNYVNTTEISGNGTGTLQIESMLPYYLYFPNKESVTIFISGTLKFHSDVGHIEQDFTSKSTLKREELWNRTNAQDRLLESFYPFEYAGNESN